MCFAAESGFRSTTVIISIALIDLNQTGLASRYYSIEKLRLAIGSVELTYATNRVKSLIMKFHGDFAIKVELFTELFFRFVSGKCSYLSFGR